jgi:UPF0755 protein
VRAMLDTRARRSDRWYRGRGVIILVVFIGFLVLAAGGLGYAYTWATGASGPHRKLDLIIPSGATGDQVGELLKDRGVIRSTLAFRLLAKFRHQDAGFEAGEYTDVTTNMSVSAVLDALKQGPFVKSVRAGFPEGLTVTQIASALGPKLRLAASDLRKAFTHGPFRMDPYIPKGSTTLEGFLFPDTYDFLANSRPKDVANRLLAQFRMEAARIDLVQRAQALHVTPYQLVIVASMIEREARFDADRPKIAAVIYNRLHKGMALQVDATVEYALGKYKTKLTLADLKVQSPYNTYLHTGLPPTPIAAPGLASLEAAANPAHADYLFYLVIDKAGHHYFTASYRDFLNHKHQVSG